MAQKYYQSSFGPSDPHAKRSEVEGYQPVSRIGEIVMNAFIDTQEFIALREHTSNKDYSSEELPPYHEWAAVLPGMVCIARKMNSQVFRHLVAAETSIPCISCVSKMTNPEDFDFAANVFDESTLITRVNDKDGRTDSKKTYGRYDDWYFAGVCRSKSVPPVDDGNGPSHDEYFTLAIGGMVTMQNSSGGVIYPNDSVIWDFRTENVNTNKSGGAQGVAITDKRHRVGPLRVGVRSTKDVNHERLIGRALSFARPGEPFDLLLKQ